MSVIDRMNVNRDESFQSPVNSGVLHEEVPKRRTLALIVLWGAFVSCLQTHTFFFLPPGTCTRTHEIDTYPLRLLEFRDCLKAGYVFPQWCTHFRQGFGSPYFGYYQPGFFYAASLLPENLGLVDPLTWTVLIFTFVGYWFTFLTVSRRFGALAGLLAGTTLALSEYGLTNLYVRGDLSEYSAMNIIPAVVYFLDGWLIDRSRMQFSGLAATSGLLVVMHPCIALASFAFLATYLGGCLFFPRLRFSALAGLASLVLGSGLAAFYCFPVFLEWDLISVNSAFEGHYHFGNYFVEMPALVIARDSLVPTDLGIATFGLLALSVISLSSTWQSLAPPQRWLLGMAGSLCAFAMFLMSSMSGLLWHHLPLLYRLQFPFRLLALLSVGVAILVGCLPQWKNTMMRRGIAIWLLFNLCLLSALNPKRQVGLMPFNEPIAAAELEKTHFAPDAADEWLPLGSKINRGIVYERTVSFEPGMATVVEGYKQSQGKLQCRVKTEHASFVDLPHHYFPGWKATMNGNLVPIHPNADGLLRVFLPANCSGDLEVVFSMTPIRGLGLFVSLNSLLLVFGIAMSKSWAPRSTPRRI